MRVCLDTNVLVAAFATRGLCEDVFRSVLAAHELVVAAVVLQELERVLVDKLRMRSPKARSIVSFLRAQADVVEVAEPAALPKSDPDDRWVLAAAIAANADYLVTGDSDLLEIAEQLEVEIVSPREFWERLR